MAALQNVLFGANIATVPNFAALRQYPMDAILNRKDDGRGTQIGVGGRVVIGDFGGGQFQWVPTSVEADDDIRVIKPLNLAVGRWHLTSAAGGQLVENSLGNSTLLAISQAAVTNAITPLKDKLDTFTSVKDAGAIPDGVTDSSPAFQTLLDTLIPAGGAPPSGGAGGEVIIPHGKYKLNTTLNVFNYAKIRGAGREATILKGVPGQPVFINRDPNALIFSHLEGFTTDGGNRGLYVTGYTDTLVIRDVSLLNATIAGITVDGFFQTAILDNVRMGGSNFGITSNSVIANNIVMIRPDITNCGCAMGLNGTEDFTVIGGRFEGGGSDTLAVLEIANAKALNFVGGYFEGGSKTLLHASANSRVHFNGTHFTWHAQGQPYLWNVDATSRASFVDCHATSLMTVPHGSIVDNCSGIVAAAGYTPTGVVNVNGVNVATSGTYEVHRQANGRARVMMSLVINQASAGYVKVAGDPSMPIVQTSVLSAINATTNRSLTAIANPGDNSIYIFNNDADVGGVNHNIVIEGNYQLA